MGYKVVGEQDIGTVTEDHPSDYLLITKGTIMSLQWISDIYHLK